MVSFRVRDVRVASLEGQQFDALIGVAEAIGGASAFPILYSLRDGEPAVEAEAFVDELRRLAAASADSDVARLVGVLRDDLFEGLAAADEG